MSEDPTRGGVDTDCRVHGTDNLYVAGSYSDIARFLGRRGFVPMGFPELQHWRRTTSEPHPMVVDGAIPCSRGQIVHGDVLFFRDPEAMGSDTDEALRQQVRAAFWAMAYEYIDHAHHILGREQVRRYLFHRHGITMDDALRTASLHLAARYRRERLRRMLGAVKSSIPGVGKIPLRSLLEKAGVFDADKQAWEG